VRGFTLIELFVTVVIASVLASIGLVSFNYFLTSSGASLGSVYATPL